MKIAMLDDDPQMLSLVRKIIISQGWDFHPFGNVPSFIEEAAGGKFDLIVVDWMMPDTSGIEVVIMARNQLALKCPLMMVSCRQSDHDVAYALQKGIDDYMVKPLRPAEFLARVHLLLKRQSRQAEVTACEWGPFRFDANVRTIKVAGVDTEVSPMEFDLALFMFSHLNLRLGRDQILIGVFGKSGKEVTRTLDTHVYRIKKKLHLDGRHGFKLVGVYGFGYRLQRSENTGEVASASAPSSSPAQEDMRCA